MDDGEQEEEPGDLRDDGPAREREDDRDRGERVGRKVVAADGDVRLRREHERERPGGEHAEHEDVDPPPSERRDDREQERTDHDPLGLQREDFVRPVVERVEPALDPLALVDLRPVDEIATTGDPHGLDRDVHEREQEDAAMTTSAARRAPFEAAPGREP